MRGAASPASRMLMPWSSSAARRSPRAPGQGRGGGEFLRGQAVQTKAEQRFVFVRIHDEFLQFIEAVPRPESAFLVAMRSKGIHPAGNWLRMTGPAAAAYILASCPARVLRCRCGFQMEKPH